MVGVVNVQVVPGVWKRCVFCMREEGVFPVLRILRRRQLLDE